MDYSMVKKIKFYKLKCIQDQIKLEYYLFMKTAILFVKKYLNYISLKKVLKFNNLKNNKVQ
jgi:hypothetical protein